MRKARKSIGKTTYSYLRPGKIQSQRGEEAMNECARIAVLIPCYNEEAAIARVVSDFKSALPSADIYV